MSDFRLPEGVRGVGGPGVPDGMLTAEEGAFLAKKAHGKRVLELGSWCGLSTIVMARTAREVWACDWHCGDGEMGGHNTLVEMWGNLLRHARTCCPVVLLVGRFEQTLPSLEPWQFDMAYIDGSHDSESVKMDTLQAQRLLIFDHPHLLVWHDADRPEVRAAAESVVGPIERGPGRLGWKDVRP